MYDNWMDGELADGPEILRHFVTATFMWPRDKMPSEGGKRLTDYGCKVFIKKTYMCIPRRVLQSDDFRPARKKES